jgi:hypothetical protein
MATAAKDYDLTRKTGYKLRKVSTPMGEAYAVLQYKTIFRFLKEFKMWTYIRDEKTKQVRMFKDLRSAQAYINYQTNPKMQR